MAAMLATAVARSIRPFPQPRAASYRWKPPDALRRSPHPFSQRESKRGAPVKAAVVRSFDRPLEIEDLPIPEPGTDQVLVRVETCGLCHTDIHAARGEWPIKPSPPFVPGHEGVGVIERVGDGPTYGLEPGMRVALPWLGYACGVCRYCNSGRETLCLQQRNTGYALDGGFAEYAIGYARHVVPVPDGVSSADASPLTCAGVTTYKAVKESGARSSDLVAVFGVGG